MRGRVLRPDLAVILVHYRAGALLSRALEALDRDLASTALTAERIVVDNGSSAEERREMGHLPVRRIDATHNPGYAAALNLGAAATTADRLVFMNPDVLVRPQCCLHLLAALETAAAAGPRFYWDEERRLLLPPTEPRRRGAELLRRLAARGDALAAIARRRWRQHAHRHWLAEAPLRSFDLSGALLAIRRDALEAVGPFDEGYRLYFEENDWLLRLAARGLTALHVPAAEAVHLYNQSAGREPAAAAWFAESQTRFERRHYGLLFSRLLSRLGPQRPAGGPAPARLDPAGLDLGALPTDTTWIEVSATPMGVPAAAERLETGESTSWRLPPDVGAHLAAGEYFVRCSTDGGAESGFYSFFHRPEPAAAAGGGRRGKREPVDARGAEWTVRSFAAGDEEAILDLFEASFHQRRSLEGWRWKYRRSPYADRQISVAIHRDGELGAHYASYPCRFVDATGAEPRTLLANQIGDTMTSRRARRVGLGRSSLLGRVTRHHFATFCEGRVAFNYGFNTGKIQRYYTRLVPGSHFLEAAPYRILERPIESPSTTLRVAAVTDLDSRWDRLLARVSASYGILVERDRTYLAWRYLDCPEAEYHLYGVFDDADLVGWGVFRRLDQTLFWGDALFDRRFPAAPARLLAEVREIHGAKGLPLEAWFPPRPDWWHRTLEDLGFESRPEPQDLGLIYKAFTEPEPGDLLRRHLYYTKGDGDLF